MKLLIITQKVDEESDIMGFFVGWIRALSSRFSEVKVLCLAKGVYDLPDNVEVISLGKERGVSKRGQMLRLFVEIPKLLYKVDVVFAHMAPEYVRAIYPFNIIFRRPILFWYAHVKVSPLAKWALGKVDFVLTPSKESFEVDSEKVVATGHGIDTERFSPAVSGANPVEEILAVSRISRVKRVETLIEALNILVNEKKVQVKVNIYGEPARREDDEYLEGLKDLVARYKLEQNFIWKGGIANKETPEIYKKHKVFVRMQGGGGFGKTELEAMSAGVPAITPTSVYQSELGDFADDLYFEEDNAKMLADKLEKVLKWSDLERSEYARLARRLVVDKHNVENVADHILRLTKLCVA